MKKSITTLLSGVLFFSMILTACQFPSSDNLSQEGEIVQTQVAMAFTQTAIAEAQEAETLATETIEAPPEEETETEELVAEITHTITPGSPGWEDKWFYDTDSSTTAASRSVNRGDDFVANLFERPFTAGDMVYRPDVDITKAAMSQDGTFYYATITLSGEHPDGGLQAAYGVEIDLNRDGRGDLLVIADRPTSTEWDIAGVSAHKDANKDVGGSSVMRPDAAYTGDGYEQEVFSMAVLDDPDMAWARVNTGSLPSVTLAFKKSLLAGYNTFVWGVWAADSLLDPALIDLHDNFTQAEAGSPYLSHANYPLAAINLVDNTCRETYNFDAETPIPGLCYIPEKPTEAPLPGTINGVAFDDLNNNGSRQDGEPLTSYTVTVTVHLESCANPSIATANTNSFTFSGLDAGTYCVKITPSGSMTTPSNYTFALPAGGTQYVEFGYQVVI